MDAPREVFILERFDGSIMVHSTKGPMVFLELEDARKMVEGNKQAEKFGDKWSVARIPMNRELGSQPFRFYDIKKCDTKRLFPNAIYLSDLRDQVAMSSNNEPGVAMGDECLELRTKLKALGVNVRAVRKVPKLRAMLAEAEAAHETVQA